ncbi:MAG: hypothetical protein EPO13_11960 [Actinomycetota bacterium]|nr:MAG: hypothetical protein EPO13_11960 [Actinomycetota bacterium]
MTTEPVSRTGAMLPSTVPAVAVPDADQLAQVVRVAFGAAAVAADLVARSLSESSVGHATDGRSARPIAAGAELALAVGWSATGLAARALRRGSQVMRPVVGFALAPPGVPERFTAAAALQRLASRWERERDGSVQALATWTASAAPAVATTAVSLVGPERVVAAVVDRVDVTAVAVGVLERLDLDRLLATAVQRTDLDQLAAAVIAQLDTAALVDAVLARVDLTRVVVDHVELGPIVTDALNTLDLTEVVRQRVDLVGLADYLVEEIDLAEIIRVSTGSIASEAVQGVRLQGIQADEALGRAVDRILFRGRRGRTAGSTPTEPSHPTESVAAAQEPLQ